MQLLQVCSANKIQVWTIYIIIWYYYDIDFFKKWYFIVGWLPGCRWVRLQSFRDWWMLSAYKSLSPSLSMRPARSQRTYHLLKSHFLLRWVKLHWGYFDVYLSPLSPLPVHIQLPPQLLNQDMTYPPPPHAPSSISSSAFHSSLDDLSSLELPHSCSNGSDDQLESLLVSAPHMWLCDGSLLCLLEPRHPDNLSAFQVLLWVSINRSAFQVPAISKHCSIVISNREGSAKQNIANTTLLLFLHDWVCSPVQWSIITVYLTRFTTIAWCTALQIQQSFITYHSNQIWSNTDLLSIDMCSVTIQYC